MDMKELKGKSEKELRRLLSETRESVRKLRFSIAQRETKQVRDIRKLRKDAARILTALGVQKKNSHI